ncbi:MAG: carbohydrate ABC transporter permease [Alphaproteobacteria bacterium]
MKRPGERWYESELWLGRAMIAPAVLYIVLLVGFPFALGLVYSVSDVTIGSHGLHWAGLDNYRRVMQGSAFWTAVGNTFLFTVISQVLVLVLAKILALALMRDFRGKWLVRLVLLLPWVAPISLGSIGWLWIFDSTYSVINWTLRATGAINPGDWPIWLGQPGLAMAAIIVVHVWRLLPFATVIVLGGLSSIPNDIHDAAAIDGAGFWRQLFTITLPLVMPILLVALLFGIVFTATDLVVVQVLTRGGPYDSTQVLASLAFFTGINGGDLGGGAAIALFLFPLLVVVAVAMLRMARRGEVT